MVQQDLDKLRAFERAICSRLNSLHEIEPGDEEAATLAARLSAVRIFELRRGDGALTDERLIQAGTAEAYYQYMMYCDLRTDGIKGFKAGDVSYTAGESPAERAGRYRDHVMTQVRDLLRDPTEFSFRRV